jgi:acyl carrier protein
MPDPATELIDYICKQIIRRPDIKITADTPLVSSGLVDSFSLVDVLSKLEDVTAMRIAASKVQPKDMDTVSLMLSTAQRLGKPRK